MNAKRRSLLMFDTSNVLLNLIFFFNLGEDRG